MRTVALYIYIDKLIDDVLTPIAHRIELFADENISITSSIQNFNDLGAIFTDYSQSFTVPASTTNNKIFKHWYESALQNGFDHRISYYGFIEIDTIPFRYGKFKLTKANAKNGMIESYSINFVGNLVQLKDKFQEDEIADLQVDGVSSYNELNFKYDRIAVRSILLGSTVSYPNVRFPLIGNTRRYQCGDLLAYDITTPTGAIDSRELFPAIPVSKILEYIQSAYGLNFSGVFFDTLEFQKLWLYCKNSETFTVQTEAILVEGDNGWDNGWNSYSVPDSTLSFNFLNVVNRIESWIDIDPSDDSVPYTVDIYDNGVLFLSIENHTGYLEACYFSRYRWDEPLINGAFPIHRFTYKLRSDFPISFTSQIEFKYLFNSSPSFSYEYSYGNTQNTNTNLNIQNYIPKIKVLDFLTGIVKMFNLMIVPSNENSFEFVTMEVWYSRGQITDITKHIDKENIDINSPRLFRKISFLFEQSTNILNNAFRGLFNRYYADLLYENQSSAFTENYEVKLPFENIMFERYPVIAGGPTTTFLTATCWDKDTNPYVPKPILLYNNGREDLLVNGVATDIEYKFSADTFQTAYYIRFSNELNIGGTDIATLISNCWSDEISAWEPTSAPPKGLYGRFYSNYIENLYNLSTRLMNYKFKMTTPLLTSLKLNDRVIVKNKRYVINKMTTNLSTKECNIELLNDFRNILTDGSVNRNTNLQSLILDNTAQDIQLQVYLQDRTLWRSKLAVGFLNGTYFKGNTYADGIMDISIPINTSGVDRQDDILIEYYKGAISTTISIPVYQYA